MDLDKDIAEMDIPDRDKVIREEQVVEENNKEAEENQQPIIVEVDPIAQQKQEIALTKASRVASEVSFIDPIAFAQMKQVATEFVADGAVSPDVKNASQMLMKLQAGREKGMGITESLNSLYLVNGKVTIFGQATIGRIKRAGWEVAYKEGDETDKEYCQAIIYKGGKPIFNTQTYAFEGFKTPPAEVYTDTLHYTDAKASDGATGPGWKPGRNRKLKLRYGAVAAVLKTYLPELLEGFADITEAANDIGNTREDVAIRIATATKRTEAPKFKPVPVDKLKDSVEDAK